MLIRRVVGLVLLSFVTVACGGESGCGSDYPYPRTDVHAAPTPQAARVRVTQGGLDTFTRATPEIITASCPVGTSAGACDTPNSNLVRFYLGTPTDPIVWGIPPIASLTLRTGVGNTLRSWVGIDPESLVDNLSVQLVDDGTNGGIRLMLGCDNRIANSINDTNCPPSTFIRGQIDAVGVASVFGGNIACHYANNASNEGFIIKRLHAVIHPRVEMRDGRPALIVESGDIVLERKDLELVFTESQATSDPSCSSGCSCLHLAGTAETVISVFGKTLVSTLVTLLADQIANNKLDLAGPLDLTALLPMVSRHANPLDYLVAAHPGAPQVTADLVQGSLGLNVDADTGFTAQRSACVPALARPVWDALPAPDPGATVLAPHPVTGLLEEEAFDAAFIMGDVMLNRAAFELFNSGGLCLALDSATITELSGGAFSPTIGLLKLVAPGLEDLGPDDAAVDLAIFPQEPPKFTFGGGEQGNSHLQATWNNAIIDIVPHVDGAKTRALSFSMDIHAGISFQPTPTGNVLLTIDELNVDNFAQTYNEIGMAFDAEGIGSIVNVFLPMLLTGEPFAFDLSSAALGIPVAPKFRAVELLGFTGNHLGLFAKLCAPSDIADANHALCYESPQVQSRAVQSAVAAQWTHDALLAGYPAQLQTHSDIAARDLELAIKVDGVGPYHSFRGVQADGTFTFAHPLFAFAGTHDVEILGRDKTRPGVWTSVLHKRLTVVQAPQKPAEPLPVVWGADAPPEAQGCQMAGDGSLLFLLLGLLFYKRR